MTIGRVLLASGGALSLGTIALSGMMLSDQGSVASSLTERQAKSPSTQITMSGYPLLLSPEEATLLSDVGLRGSVLSISPATWTTSTGNEPTADDRTDSIPDVIYRVAVVEVEDVFHGELRSDTITVPLLGGETATASMIVEQELGIDANVGDKVLLFLKEPPVGWRLDGAEMSIVDMYRIEDGVAVHANHPHAPVTSVIGKAVEASGVQ